MLRQHIPPEKAQTEMQNVVRIKSPCTKAQMHVVLHSLSLCERECVCVRKREESVLCANVIILISLITITLDYQSNQFNQASNLNEEIGITL